MPSLAVADESLKKKLRVAIIGQSTFAAEVFKLLQRNGHEVVGVFTVLDKGHREDPLATIAAQNNKPVFKYKTWRVKGKVIPEILEEYKSVNADINVLPFCTQFIPKEVVLHPKYQSICYHPSILPRHRGASSINWTLIEGDTTCGLTIFWTDDGLDTGPILVQKSFPCTIDDTVDSLYNKYLYPEGIKALAESVNMVANGVAPRINQTVEGATEDPALIKPETYQIDWSKGGLALHNFIRGLDSSPGATTLIKPQTKDGTDENSDANLEIKFFGSSLWEAEYETEGDKLLIPGLNKPAIVHDGGLLITANDGIKLNIQRLKVNGKMINAQNFFKASESKVSLSLTAEEKQFIEKSRDIWKAILRIEIENDTDFFTSGAGSMDVVRLVEEIKDLANLELQNEDIYMNTTFEDFYTAAILKQRGDSGSKEIVYDGVELKFNKMKFKSMNEIKSVLVIYTGGTLGMMKNKHGKLTNQKNLEQRAIRKLPQLHDEEYWQHHLINTEMKEYLVLPRGNDTNTRVLYKIYEYDELKDSSDLTIDDWIKMAGDIKRFYNEYDGFVVLHGTDTMAYGASALSFMLEVVGKTVVLTGAQVPIFQPRSDGNNNLLCAILIAATIHIPEVTVFFGSKLFRGTRVKKISNTRINAFGSPNFPPLIEAKTTLLVDPKMFIHPPNSVPNECRLHDQFSKKVSLLKISPTITPETIRAMFHASEGVVLETYGNGNMPIKRKDIYDEIEKAVRNKVLIVNVTQCINGTVIGKAIYETGRLLMECGVVPAFDMTTEAAFAKLSYVLTKTELNYTEKVELMKTNIRGELNNPAITN